MSEWIDEEDWETIVENVPIVSVDLVVECPKGIVLGQRLNKPAKGEWFVPGGRVQKGERRREAVYRIAKEELGVTVEIREELGGFEHFYKTSDVGCEKHYVAHGYHVWTEETAFETDDQHAEITVFEQLPRDLHQYVKDYLDTAGILQTDQPYQGGAKK